MKLINEKTTHYLSATFKDKTGAAVIPAAATYRIDDVLSGTVILTDTAIAPAATIEITLTPVQNTLVSQLNPSEVRRVTVTGTYGASDAISEEFEYALRNLGNLT